MIQKLNLLGLLFMMPALAIGGQPQSNPNDDIARAEEILALHADNCGGGAKGWWVDVSNPAFFWQARFWGGIDPNTGKYNGCGSCAQCKTAISQSQNYNTSNARKTCASVGGVVKNTRRGEYPSETKISKTSWLWLAYISIDCQRWVPCP
jgi:hypothetical protein